MKIMVIGAHPDDPEAMFGGSAMLYRDLGHSVCMVSMTNGDAGHHEMNRAELAERRHKEAMEAAKIMDVDYIIMPIHDCELTASIENRNKLIKLVRNYNPDIIITHPLDDYHPDHRNTAQLVMDISYLLVVPNVVPESKVMRIPPYFFFSTETPILGCINICVSIDSVWDRKLNAWHQHESQMYEWMPWVKGELSGVPNTEHERLKYLSNARGIRHRQIADAFNMGKSVQYAEAISATKFGNIASIEKLKELFPFGIINIG
jgi:N-acetylglucosamine malate deacetylase 1